MQKASVQPAEAKNRLSELMDRVSRCAEIVISRHNADVAPPVPVGRAPRRDISEGNRQDGRDPRAQKRPWRAAPSQAQRRVPLNMGFVLQSSLTVSGLFGDEANCCG